MEYLVNTTPEFESWFFTLDEPAKASILASISLLETYGPTLEHPHTSAIEGSAHSKMRELRVQNKRRPFRILYAFDPSRSAILLLGGDKTGNKRWYKENIPKADKLYTRHLDWLKQQ